MKIKTSVGHTDTMQGEIMITVGSNNRFRRFGNLFAVFMTITSLMLIPAGTVFSDENAETVLRLHGSNTVGAELAPALAKAFIQQILHAENISGTPGSNLNEMTVSGSISGKKAEIEIRSYGTATGFTALKEKKCDIAMASRPISPKENKELQALGNMTTCRNEHVIALDGIAVIVHPINRLRSVNISDLAGIFSGKIRNWSETGGNGKEIHVYTRDEKSGTFQTFRNLALQGNRIAENAEICRYHEDIADKVARDPDGIGYVGLPYIFRTKALAVSDGESTALKPAPFTVKTEDYILSRRLFLYAPSPAPGSYTGRFIDFVLSPAGQQIVRDTGFVNLDIELSVTRTDPDQSSQNASVLDEYLQTVEKAQRLSLNFRFHSGSFDLDNKALADLERVTEFLQQKNFQELLLIGFADSEGDYNNNCNLARRRAEKIAGELGKKGIKPFSVYSACEEIPVGSNETEEGRAKNRRVEIWVR